MLTKTPSVLLSLVILQPSPLVAIQSLLVAWCSCEHSLEALVVVSLLPILALLRPDLFSWATAIVQVLSHFPLQILDSMWHLSASTSRMTNTVSCYLSSLPLIIKLICILWHAPSHEVNPAMCSMIVCDQGRCEQSLQQTIKPTLQCKLLRCSTNRMTGGTNSSVKTAWCDLGAAQLG